MLYNKFLSLWEIFYPKNLKQSKLNCKKIKFAETYYECGVF